MTINHRKLFILGSVVVILQMLLMPIATTKVYANEYTECLKYSTPDNCSGTTGSGFGESDPIDRAGRPSGTGDFLQDAALGVLNTAICSGGSLKERLGTAAEAGAVELASYGVDKGLEWLTGPNGPLFKQETLQKVGEIVGTLGAVAGTALPIVGPLIGGVLGNLLGGDGEKPFREEDLRLKDNCIDAIARVTAQDILKAATGSTVNWIQTEFENGNPGFATDLYGRFLELSDSEAFRFLTSQDFINATCYAFRDDVYAGTLEEYYRKHPGESGFSLQIPQSAPGSADDECALEKLLGGADQARRFMEGDLSVGGWNAWLEYTVNPTGNPFDAKMSLSRENESRIKASIELEDKEIGYGGGYIAMKKCRDGSQPIGPNICSDKSRPIVITPASLVQDIISDMLSSETRRAETADELNEIVDDFTYWTLNTIFKKDRGLLGAESNKPDVRTNLVAEIDRIIIAVKRALSIEDAIKAKQEQLYNQVRNNENISWDTLDFAYQSSTDTLPPPNPPLCQIGQLPDGTCTTEEDWINQNRPSIPGDGINVITLTSNIASCNNLSLEVKSEAANIRGIYTEPYNNAAVVPIEDVGIKAIEFREALAVTRRTPSQEEQENTPPARIHSSGITGYSVPTITIDNAGNDDNEDAVDAYRGSLLEFFMDLVIRYDIKEEKAKDILSRAFGIGYLMNPGSDFNDYIFVSPTTFGGNLSTDYAHSFNIDRDILQNDSASSRNRYIARYFGNIFNAITEADYMVENPHLTSSAKYTIVKNLPDYVDSFHDEDIDNIRGYILQSLGSVGVKIQKREDITDEVIFFLDGSPVKGYNGIRHQEYDQVMIQLRFFLNKLLQNLTEEDFYELGSGESPYSENRLLINSIILDFRPSLKEPEGTVGGSKVTLERIAELRAEFDAINKHSQSDLDGQEDAYADFVNTVLNLYIAWKDACGSSTGGAPVSADIWINDWIADGVYESNASPKRNVSSVTISSPAYIEIVWEMHNATICTASRNGSNNDNAVVSHPTEVTGDRQWVSSYMTQPGTKWIGPITSANTFTFNCSGNLPGGNTGNVSDTFEVIIDNNNL